MVYEHHNINASMRSCTRNFPSSTFCGVICHWNQRSSVIGAPTYIMSSTVYSFMKIWKSRLNSFKRLIAVRQPSIQLINYFTLQDYATGSKVLWWYQFVLSNRLLNYETAKILKHDSTRTTLCQRWYIPKCGWKTIKNSCGPPSWGFQLLGSWLKRHLSPFRQPWKVQKYQKKIFCCLMPLVPRSKLPEPAPGSVCKLLQVCTDPA